MQRSESQDTGHGSLCPNRRDYPASRPTLGETSASSTESLPSNTQLGPESKGDAPDTKYLNSQLDKLSLTNQETLSHVAITESERQVYREKAEEQAMALRDDKLLTATRRPLPAPLISGGSGAERRGKPMRLTTENVSKLDDEQGSAKQTTPPLGRRGSCLPKFGTKQSIPARQA